MGGGGEAGNWGGVEACDGGGGVADEGGVDDTGGGGTSLVLRGSNPFCFLMTTGLSGTLGSTSTDLLVTIGLCAGEELAREGDELPESPSSAA